MLTKSIPVFLILLCLELSQAFYGYNGATNENQLSTCTFRSKPCRLRVDLDNLNGSRVDSITAQTCACNYPNNCPSDWNTPRHVVNRKVISDNYDITLKMMFCTAVEPVQICRRNRISLVLKGSLHLPQDIVDYNCRCRRRKPLWLRERSIGEDHETYHSYGCANHVAYCTSSEVCMTVSQYSTQYHCKCRGSDKCRLPHQETYMAEGVSYNGTCTE